MAAATCVVCGWACYSCCAGGDGTNNAMRDAVVATDIRTNMPDAVGALDRTTEAVAISTSAASSANAAIVGTVFLDIATTSS